MSGTFSETGSVQTYTVGATGDYTITADGAAGGNGDTGGGAGASVSATFLLTAGDVIEIIVGQAGGSGMFAGGGGGGTFVYDETTNTLLEVAGGGGGGSSYTGGGGGDDGQASTSGDGGNGPNAGNGGKGGDGGTGGTDSGLGGGGGGGYSTAGTNGAGYGGGGGGGSAWSSSGNMSGGSGSTAGGPDDAGGYGGGGGGDEFNGGGGGGYSGGGGGDGGEGGGGGGSFVNTTFSQFVTGSDVETTGGNTNAEGSADIEQTACFAAGTRILTIDGEIPVEDIKPGDTIIILGETGPTTQKVTWTGTRSLDLARQKHPEKARPIRFAAGCLADNVPARDLYLSPDHALYIDGILVPAKALLNGASIRQIAPPCVTYYHIELAEHAVILAESTPAETYLETGNRGAFENGAGAVTLYPDFAQTAREVKSCAPFIESGHLVEEIRARILARANIATTDDPAISVVDHQGAAIIQSRHAIPGLTTPDPRDRRRLGVKIAGLAIGGHRIPVDHPALVSGWYDAEPDGRWTDGHAVIPAELLRGATKVTVILAGTLPYPVAA